MFLFIAPIKHLYNVDTTYAEYQKSFLHILKQSCNAALRKNVQDYLYLYTLVILLRYLTDFILC